MVIKEIEDAIPTLNALNEDRFPVGLVCEYVKYCRGISAVTPEILYEYTKTWSKGFKTKPIEDEKPGRITAQTL